MPYVTKLPDKIPYLNETDCRALEPTRRDYKSQGLGLGYVPRKEQILTPEQAQFCAPMPAADLIPRSEWRALIEMKDRDESWLDQLRAAQKIKTLSQGSTNYCWMFGSVNAMRVLAASHGYNWNDLCPTSAAVRVKNFRNNGGNTFDAIPHLAKYGCSTTKTYPLNKISRALDTQESQQEALRYRLLEWWELKGNSFDHAASSILRNKPVILGLMWWSHMVLGLRLVATNNGYGILIENSHGSSYGDDGLAVLEERRSTAFDQASPRVVTHADMSAVNVRRTI